MLAAFRLISLLEARAILLLVLLALILTLPRASKLILVLVACKLKSFVELTKFIELSAIELGWKGIKWEGEGINEIGRRIDTNEIVIKIDKKYFRPCEVNTLVGDARKAKKELNWQPKISLEELVAEMIKHDRDLAIKDNLLKNKGYDLTFPRD